MESIDNISIGSRSYTGRTGRYAASRQAIYQDTARAGQLTDEEKEAYMLLGLKPGAGRETIKAAYRRLAKQYHPDRNPSVDAARHFIRITEAYHLLMGDERSTATMSSWYGFAEEYQATETQYYTHSYGPDTTYEQEMDRQERARRYAEMKYREFRDEMEAFRHAWYYYPFLAFNFLLLCVYAAVAVACVILPARTILHTGQWSYLYIYVFTLFMAGLTVLAIIDILPLFKPYLPNFVRQHARAEVQIVS